MAKAPRKKLSPAEAGAIGGSQSWHRNRAKKQADAAKGGNATTERYGSGYMRELGLYSAGRLSKPPDPRRFAKPDTSGAACPKGGAQSEAETLLGTTPPQGTMDNKGAGDPLGGLRPRREPNVNSNSTNDEQLQRLQDQSDEDREAEALYLYDKRLERIEEEEAHRIAAEDANREAAYEFLPEPDSVRRGGDPS